jgi:hypothetical protein
LPGRFLRDRVGRTREALSLEHRLDHLALLAPQGALAGQQAVSKRPAGVDQPDSLHVVGMVVGEHPLGGVRMVEEVQGLGAHRQPDGIAVLGRQRGHQA